ncbi:YaaA family protein [Salinibacterium soli]|uniref:Peroxide stress protein YaaA n=1 Tax=Antiquaquibacter soli TaxID=3064523 RepID=A0ABT9BKH5_9MICO|nr:peroxide stress protein YaaA [Protaetiibacter sp. WY-16]MDO7881522.1 peroxide stress protein YaaA [Protaetiibacter sp. WY-16]
MLLVLPPSETKRDGGRDGSALDLAALSFPALTPLRRDALAALSRVSRTVSGASQALGLGPTQRFEIERNRLLRSSPVMPAIERYTGVLYDGLDVDSLSAAAREFAHDHVAVHSALFGVVGAGDLIPAYRLSHDSRLPGMPLKKHWRSAVSAELAAHDGLVLDLRSEAYAALGPAPDGAHYIRVVTESASGRRVALSHFNKKAKGEFARAIVAAGVEHPDASSLLDWAETAGIRLEPGAPGELDLIVG